MDRWLVLCVLLLPVSAQTRSDGATDAQRLAEAQYALSQKDCATARDALTRVSPAFQTNATWVYALAQALECLQDYQGAADRYSQYNKMVPGQPEVSAKIGAMLYLMDKATAAHQAADAQKAVAAEQSALDKAQEVLATSLAQFGDFTFRTGTVNLRYTLTVTVKGCVLRTTEKIVGTESSDTATVIEREEVPLADIDPDSIGTGTSSTGLIRGSYTSMSTVDDKPSVRHTDHNDYTSEENATHISSVRYFSDQQSNADSVATAFLKTVKACAHNAEKANQ